MKRRYLSIDAALPLAVKAGSVAVKLTVTYAGGEYELAPFNLYVNDADANLIGKYEATPISKVIVVPAQYNRHSS